MHPSAFTAVVSFHTYIPVHTYICTSYLSSGGRRCSCVLQVSAAVKRSFFFVCCVKFVRGFRSTNRHLVCNLKFSLSSPHAGNINITLHSSLPQSAPGTLYVSYQMYHTYDMIAGCVSCLPKYKHVSRQMTGNTIESNQFGGKRLV